MLNLTIEKINNNLKPYLNRFVYEIDKAFVIIKSNISDFDQYKEITNRDDVYAKLYKFCDELFELKKQIYNLSDCADELLQYIDDFKKLRHGMKSIDECLNVTEKCEVISRTISSEIDRIYTEIQNVNIYGISNNADDLVFRFECFKSVAYEIEIICKEITVILIKIKTTGMVYNNSESHLNRDKYTYKDVMNQSEILSPQPVHSSYSISYEDDYSKNKKESKQVNNKGSKQKFGIFGLFTRKKKDADTVDENKIVPPPTVDSVKFSAVAPKKIVSGKYVPINIVMYEDTFRKAVDEIIRSHGDSVNESKSGYHDVERNSLIRVILSSPEITIDDNTQEQIWNGKYLNFEFAVKIPSDFSEEQILFSATIYINDIVATKLKLILDCQGKAKHNVSITRTDILSAFVSYASQDRNRVAAIIQGMKKARPDMDIFFDIESLRSGDKWENTLKTEIESRDILFLCWSKYAKDSKWVDMEWRYALESKGEDCIEPIPIDSPDICPPPVELQQKHFNDKMLFIIKATMSNEDEAGPCLIRLNTKERFPINKSIVRIGKERNYVDIFISDNPTISREHANIVFRNGQYYIIDKNSLNHTYVDGKAITSNVEVAISFGMIIKLANEEFEFTFR